jgi:signal peptidase I
MLKPVRFTLLAILAAVATIRIASPLTVTTVLGHSMAPTLRPGSSYVLDRSYYRSHALCQGDIVVFRLKGETYIKRVHALPGDRVWVLRDDDGEDRLLEPSEVARFRRLNTGGRLARYRVIAVTIPPDHCYVLGDNRANSIDSRELGPVPVSGILGRVMQ